MFGGRGGGRGRGARGGRGGRSGPRLPAKLTKELFGEEAAGGGGGRGHLSRKDRRKAEREARKGGGIAGRDSLPSQRQQQQQRGQPQPSGKGDRGAGGPRQPPAKRQKLGSAPAAQGGTLFESLLPAHLQAKGGQDPELELQRRLARKLGLKKGKTKMGGEDGLDEFLEELGGIDDVFAADADDGDAAMQGGAAAAAGRKRKHAAEAPPNSEEEEEEGGSASDDFSEEEEGDEVGLGGSSEGDSLLAGLESDSEGGSELGPDSDDGGSSSDGGLEPGGGADWPQRRRLQRPPYHEDDKAGSEGSSGEEEGSEGDLLASSSDGEEMEGSGSEVEEEEEGKGGGIEQQQQQQQQPAAAGKYVPPAARRAAAAGGGGEAAERVQRRVRGLLNRLAESNLQGIVGELAELYEQEGRRLVSDAVCGELVAAAAEGPRASDRFAAVSAAAVAGLAGTARAAEIVANFLDRLARRLEAAAAGGDGLACRNLAMVAAHLFLAGALRPDLVHSMLDSWRQRFTETDVSLIATFLHAAGLQLRAADPVAMKELVLAVHTRAAEAGGAGALSKRAAALLELVVDVKNNRRREEAKHRQVVLAPIVGKWLRGCGAGDVAVGGISWAKVLQPDKKGIWWMPEARDAAPSALGGSAALRAATAEAAAGLAGDGGLAGPELLKLAASLRMNTDVRRSVFCCVMGAEDCMDAAERLLRLGLKGEQEREVTRVTVECCLQEKAWNAYYAHLLLRLCGVGKGHKMTLQFCFWDHMKEVGDMDVRRLTNLARLMAAVMAGGGLPPSALKAYDFAAAPSAREVLFWRIFFEHLLGACKTPVDSADLFKRIAAKAEVKALRVGLLAFLRRSVGPWLAAREPGSGGLSSQQLGELLRRLRGAEKALAG